MAYIPADELVTAQLDLSNNAYKLLMYYYSKGDRWEWKDNEISEALKMSVRKVREYRSELVRMEYLHVVKGPITHVFIGRQAVMDWKTPEMSDPETGEFED